MSEDSRADEIKLYPGTMAPRMNPIPFVGRNWCKASTSNELAVVPLWFLSWSGEAGRARIEMVDSHTIGFGCDAWFELERFIGIYGGRVSAPDWMKARAEELFERQPEGLFKNVEETERAYLERAWNRGKSVPKSTTTILLVLILSIDSTENYCPLS